MSELRFSKHRNTWFDEQNYLEKTAELNLEFTNDLLGNFRMVNERHVMALPYQKLEIFDGVALPKRYHHKSYDSAFPKFTSVFFLPIFPSLQLPPPASSHTLIGHLNATSPEIFFPGCTEKSLF